MAFCWECVCLKHPGFSEEREWRLFFSSGVNYRTANKRQKSVENTGDIPQQVVGVPLGESLLKNETVMFQDLVRHIIICLFKYSKIVRACSEIENV